jgi:predicted dinucleotide-binding enzyme
MDITIIAPGKMGRAIGTRAVPGGHSVTFVGKTLESAQEAAEELKACNFYTLSLRARLEQIGRVRLRN